MEQAPGQRSNDQREALKQSAKNATTSEPQNFRDKANAEKVVEIPRNKQNKPIQGMDPDDRGRKAR